MLMRLLEEKFTKTSTTPWPDRDATKKSKYKLCVSKVINIVSGGDVAGFLDDFSQTKPYSDMIVFRPQVREDVLNLVKNLQVVYHRL